MKIPAKIDYACRALLALSLHWPSPQPMQIQDIAKRQKIPTKFLVHILIQLKQLGYVESSRGKNGGYILVKAPESIKLSAVLKNLGGLGCFMEPKKHQKRLNIFDYVWEEIDEEVLKIMDKISFDTICSRELKDERPIAYDI